jgi:hypothetical protein
MPRNPNLRIDLECDHGKWKFVLHKDSQALCSARGYDSPVTAVQEAMVLVSCLRLAKDREKRRAEQPTEGVQQPDQ